jgi:hypothetical protein
MFHTGASGEAPPWEEVLRSVAEVRESARRYLDSLGLEEINRIVPYTGGIEYLRGPGLKLSYAVLRTATHNFEHTGEILTVRSLLRHRLEGSWVWGERLM